MSRIATKTKLKEGRGTGSGKEYRPFIKTREFNSNGTCSNIVDWKTGRQMQFLSQTELYIFMQLRWEDDIDEIREQYPLDLEKLNALIDKTNEELTKENRSKLTLKYDENHWLTSDMVIYRKGIQSEVISVKYDKNNLSPKEIETVWIEKKYWNQEGCRFRLLDRKDVNEILVKNLRLVMEYYDESRVYDAKSRIKHLIATKQIDVDIEHTPIDFRKLQHLLPMEES